MIFIIEKNNSLDKLEQKIEKADDEIGTIKRKIESYKTKLREVETYKESLENTRIIMIVKSVDITPDTLKAIISATKTESFLSTQTVPQIINKSEKEKEIDDEETL